MHTFEDDETRLRSNISFISDIVTTDATWLFGISWGQGGGGGGLLFTCVSEETFSFFFNFSSPAIVGGLEASTDWEGEINGADEASNQETEFEGEINGADETSKLVELESILELSPHIEESLGLISSNLYDTSLELSGAIPMPPIIISGSAVRLIDVAFSGENVTGEMVAFPDLEIDGELIIFVVLLATEKLK